MDIKSYIRGTKMFKKWNPWMVEFDNFTPNQRTAVGEVCGRMMALATYLGAAIGGLIVWLFMH